MTQADHDITTICESSNECSEIAHTDFLTYAVEYRLVVTAREIPEDDQEKLSWP